MNDPIQLWRRRRLRVLAGGVMVLTLCGTWAFWPLPTLELPEGLPNGSVDRTDPDDAPAPLNRLAFAAPIWNPPPAPEGGVRQDREDPSENPIRLELIGIASERAESGRLVLRAALYDPETDRLHLVESGERIGAVTVREIAADRVELVRGTRVARISLREEDGS